MNAPKTSSIKKLGQKIQVNRIQENFDLALIGWSGVNLYYQNATHGSD